MPSMHRRLRSDVQLPISAQRSLLDFLFAQEQVQGCGNSVGALAEVVPLSRARRRLRPLWGTVGGLCERRWKSYRRVLDAPLSCFAAHVGTGPHRFPDTVWS